MPSATGSSDASGVAADAEAAVSNVREGGCLCGAVRYRLTGPLGAVVMCHCSQCRKAQGGAFALVAPLRAADFALLSGRAELREYESSPGKWRSFCGRCGSPLYSRRDGRPEALRLRIGSLDAPGGDAPQMHIHVASKALWWTITDSLPQHAGVEPGRI